MKGANGGPASFQKKLSESLNNIGYKIFYDIGKNKCDALLLINATRHWGALLKTKYRGTNIVQRLGSTFTSIKNYPVKLLTQIHSWVGFKNISCIRRYIADRIVYQSEFVKECWEMEYGKVKKPCYVIYNGVDLNKFTPEGPKYDSPSNICIISVEGTQIYPEHSAAFLVTQELNNRGFDVELLVFGNPWHNTANRYNVYPFVKLKGQIPNEELPYFYRGASFFVSNDVIAGCPNSVIESLACGTPVIGYHIAVLPEIITPDAGICVPAEGNPWKEENAGNIGILADAAMEIVKNKSFRRGARKLAENRYGLDQMVDQYTRVLFQ
jgi:glycosyltransferase involved in cell wall biosynthesis